MTATVTTPTDTLETVAVADLTVDINVRGDARLDPSFVSSIRNHGILQPPVGWRDDDGKVHVTAGQRRTLAAREIGMTAIQVVIKPKAYADAVRVVAQLTENDQRDPLTDTEHLAAYQQLALFGVSVDMIARRTNAPKKRVETALTVAGSDVARDALAAAPITLEQAAVLVEFQDDVEHVDRLLQVAADRPGYFDHQAEQIRRQRAYIAATAALTEKLTKTGWEVVDHIPAGARRLNELWVAGDAEHTRLTATSAKNYTGRFARIYQDWNTQQPRAEHLIVGWADQSLDTDEWRKHSTDATPTGPTKEEKAEKRRVNADMRAATTVRRTWISTHLLPKVGPRWPFWQDGMAYIAGALAATPGHLDATDARVYALACELLDIPYEPSSYGYDSGPQRDALHAALPSIAPFTAALAIALARTEAVVGDPKATDFALGIRGASYLTQLHTWGYTLADVEQAVIDRAAGTVHDVVTDTTEEAPE